jgi:hypothetical protein
MGQQIVSHDTWSALTSGMITIVDRIVRRFDRTFTHATLGQSRASKKRRSRGLAELLI